MDADDGNPFRSEEHHDRGSWNSPVTIGWSFAVIYLSECEF
jgi:hypothetical protein